MHAEIFKKKKEEKFNCWTLQSLIFAAVTLNQPKLEWKTDP